MTCLEHYLRQLAGQVQQEIRGALSGLSGILVRGYLPQTWNVQTENGSATFNVDSKGNARVTSGLAANPDVTIAASHRMALAALSGDRATAQLYSNEARVTTHTGKGATAWSFLRGRLGF